VILVELKGVCKTCGFRAIF